MAPLFGPRQLGVGIQGGCEAAIYSARHYLQSLAPNHIMVKLDFANVFSSLHRSDMLLSVRDCLPELPLIVLTAIVLLFWISCHSVPGGPTTR